MGGSVEGLRKNRQERTRKRRSGFARGSKPRRTERSSLLLPDLKPISHSVGPWCRLALLREPCGLRENLKVARGVRRVRKAEGRSRLMKVRNDLWLPFDRLDALCIAHARTLSLIVVVVGVRRTMKPREIRVKPDFRGSTRSSRSKRRPRI